MGRRRSVGFATALGATLALAACGGNGSTAGGGVNGITSRSPEQILSAANTASTGAASVRAAVSGNANGLKLAGYVDFVAGKGVSGTFTSGHGVLDLIVTGGTAYLRGNPAMWQLLTHKSAIGQLLGGKWVAQPTTGPAASGLGELNQLSFARVTHLLGKQHGTLTKGPVSTVNGQQVIALHSSNGVTLYVATTGNPYVLRTTGGGIGDLTYSDYGRSFSINRPRHAINLSQLEAPSGKPPAEL